MSSSEYARNLAKLNEERRAVEETATAKANQIGAALAAQDARGGEDLRVALAFTRQQAEANPRNIVAPHVRTDHERATGMDGANIILARIQAGEDWTRRDDDD